MKIKISVNNEDIRLIGAYDCSEGFTNLITAIEAINVNGDTKTTYTLQIIIDSTESIEITSDIHFRKNMKLELRKINQANLILTGEITVKPHIHVEFYQIQVNNPNVDNSRVFEPEFTPLVQIRRISGLNTFNHTDQAVSSTIQSTPQIQRNSSDKLIRTAPKSFIHVKPTGNDNYTGLTEFSAKKQFKTR